MFNIRLIQVVLICILLLTAGCSCFEDKRVVVEPRVKPLFTNNRNKYMTLAYFTEKYYDTTGWTTEEIAAELSLQEYYMNKE